MSTPQIPPARTGGRAGVMLALATVGFAVNVRAWALLSPLAWSRSVSWSSARSCGPSSPARPRSAPSPSSAWPPPSAPAAARRPPGSPGSPACFGVDAGLACFLDAEEREHYADQFEDDLPDQFRDAGDFWMLDDGRLLAYRRGWGDGVYPTWIGRDENGEVVCFVTDLLR